MLKRQLKRTLETLGLELVSVDGNYANATNIRLKAPDGTVGKFTISRIDDPHSDRLALNQFKHFARDHAHSLDLPGVSEIDEAMAPRPRVLNGMTMAIMAAHEHPPKDILDGLKEALAEQPCIDPEGAMRAAIIETTVQPEPEMPKPTLTIATPLEVTRPNMNFKGTAADPAPKRVRNVQRMGQVEFFKLCEIAKGVDMAGIDSYPKMAERLAKLSGRPVAQGTARDALEATGKRLDKAIVQLTADESMVVIAKTLVSLMSKMGEPVPDELRAICGEIA